jgi:polysaccharide export outer membrane protein
MKTLAKNYPGKHLTLFCTMFIIMNISLAFADPLPRFELGPEDVLEISVWKDEALTRQVMVRPDGKISFPLIGDIQVSGLNVEELRQRVQKKLQKYVPDAPVSVLLVKIASPKIYIIGKVNRPGVFIMGQPLSITQALAMAGGVTLFAGDKVLIIRSENGQQKTIVVNFEKIADGKNLSENIFLKPDDTIIIP